MKGPSLQKQFNALSEKYSGKKLDVELQPHDGTWNGYDATFRTIKHEHWQLVINDAMQTCEQKCKQCGKCGLWAVDGFYFVKCSDIMKIDLDIE